MLGLISLGIKFDEIDIINRVKYKVIPISWFNRKKNVSKFKIKEMQNRYIFTVLYVWFEKILLQKNKNKD